MAVLEEEGYITQPHTSAGRVPTDKGYRLFVDRLSAVKPLSAAERRAIEQLPRRRGRPARRAAAARVRLLAQLTRQVAVVQYPTLSRSAVRHLEVVQLAADPADAGADHRHRPGRAAGRRAARCDVDAEAVADLRALLNAALRGRRAGRRAGDKVPDLPDARRPQLRAAGRRGQRRAAGDPGRAGRRSGWCIGGTANLARGSALDFPGTSGRCWRRWRSRWCCCG